MGSFWMQRIFSAAAMARRLRSIRQERQATPDVGLPCGRDMAAAEGQTMRYLQPGVRRSGGDYGKDQDMAIHSAIGCVPPCLRHGIEQCLNTRPGQNLEAVAGSANPGVSGDP